MAEIIKDKDFKLVACNVKPDSRNRVVLSERVQLGEDITYHVYINEVGQILLDPQVSISASELRLYKNKKALESVQKGLKQSARGELVDFNTEELED